MLDRAEGKPRDQHSLFIIIIITTTTVYSLNLVVCKTKITVE